MERAIVLEAIVEEAAKSLQANKAWLFLRSNSSESLHCAVCYQTDKDYFGSQLFPGKGFPAEFAEVGSASIIEDISAWSRNGNLFEGEEVGFLIGAPIHTEKAFHGMLLINRPSTSLPYSEADLGLLELFAKQATFALETQLLSEDDRHRRDVLEALQQAGVSLTSTLELSSVLDTILSHTLELIEADDAHIFLYDGGRLSFGAARWADQRKSEPYSEPRKEGITITVASSGERIVSDEVNLHPLFKKYKWGGAIASLPLKIEDAVVGVMNVAFEAPHQFSDDELGALELFADQAAVALNNARIFEYVSSDRRNVQLLYDLTNTLVSTVDQVEIVQKAIELTTRSLKATSGEVYLLDPVSGSLALAAFSKLEHASGEIQRPSASTEIEKMVLEDMLPMRIVEGDPRWAARWDSEIPLRSMLSAPILTGEKILGVITLLSEQRMRVAHLDLLTSIAKQVGLALSNARKFHEVERRLAELTALQKVGSVVNNRLEMQDLLNAVVEQVGEVLGYEIVELHLVEGEMLVLRAMYGLSGEQVQVRPLSQGIIGKVARSNQAAYVPDTSTDPDYVTGFAEGKAEIAVPLSKGEIVIGVLNVESSTRGGLDENDLRLLRLLADQVLSAIENATLYDRLQTHAVELEQTVEDRTAALEEALEQARVAERLKSQFVADVSHELRTPLANIRLYLELLNFGNPERAKEYLDTLARETDRLVILIEDLLAISRLDTGTAVPNLKPHDLNVIIQGLVSDRQRLVSEKSLDIQFLPADNLPMAILDSDMFTKAIANLITNAMNYTAPGGSISLETGLQDEDGRKWVTVSVADTGFGIAPEEEARVFERFYRGQAGRRTQVPGTGLGLAISKEIIDRHNGRITLNSEVNQGTEFTVWIPLL